MTVIVRRWPCTHVELCCRNHLSCWSPLATLGLSGPDYGFLLKTFYCRDLLWPVCLSVSVSRGLREAVKDFVPQLYISMFSPLQCTPPWKKPNSCTPLRPLRWRRPVDIYKPEGLPLAAARTPVGTVLDNVGPILSQCACAGLDSHACLDRMPIRSIRRTFHRPCIQTCRPLSYMQA